MKIGTVTGSVWATRKANCLMGQTFLLVDTDTGELVAADQVGAGKGDRVLLATGTVAARYCMDAPIDAAVVAILDPEGIFENQPPFCQLRFLHGAGLVDGIVSPLRRQNAVLPPHRLGNDLRRRIADGQSLPHRLQYPRIVQPRRQRIHRQHPPGGHRGGIQGLVNGIGHIVSDKIPADCPIKDILLAVLQGIGGIAVVEEGQIQPGGMIRHLHLGQIQALANMVRPGMVHDHGFEAGGLIHLQFIDGHKPCPILIAPGKMADQIPEGENIQIFKLLGLGRPHALEDGDRI